MDFSTSESESTIRKVAREFAEKEMRPVVMNRGNSRVRSSISSRSWDFWG
jgi:hypothetical protein